MKRRGNTKIRKCKPRVFAEAELTEDNIMINNQGLIKKHKENLYKPKPSKKNHEKVDSFQVKEVKPKSPKQLKSKWKPVPVNYGIDFDGFGGIEELTDYNSECPKTLKRKTLIRNDDNDGVAKKRFKQQLKPSKKDKTIKNQGESNFKFSLIHSPKYIAKMKHKKNTKKKNIIINESQIENSEKNSNTGKLAKGS